MCNMPQQQLPSPYAQLSKRNMVPCSDLFPWLILLLQHNKGHFHWCHDIKHFEHVLICVMTSHHAKLPLHLSWCQLPDSLKDKSDKHVFLFIFMTQTREWVCSSNCELLRCQQENIYILCRSHLQLSPAECKYISYLYSWLWHRNGCAARTAKNGTKLEV